MTNSSESLVKVSIWKWNTLSLALLPRNIDLVGVLKESKRIANKLELTLYSTVLSGQINEDFTQLRK
jgi:hypothetical protein